MADDFFREQDFMRALLEREATQRAARFGVERRDFLASAMGALAALSVFEQAPAFRSRAEAQAGFVPPPDDCYAELQADHATFRSVQASSALDWEIIQAAANAQERAVPDIVLGMLDTLSGLYSGFGVHQLEHMTQTATRAVRANAPDEWVLVSLIHDAGKVISNANHPEIVAALARPYMSNDAYRGLRHHMEFQWKHYGDKLGLPTDGRTRYQDQPWYAATALFSDEWDQVSFDPAYNTLPLSEFEPLVRSVFGRAPQHIPRTASDCLTP
jgi:predicted HD phosphohydrolase